MRRRGQSGQIIPLVAISLTAIMGFGGLAVDNGYWQYAQRQQQSAADAAAIGGAQALALAGCPNSSAALTAAQNDAARNGFTSSQVTVSNPPSGGAYSGNPCAVSVSITKSQPRFLSSVISHNAVTETTSATAQLVSNNSTSITLLSPTGTSSFGGGNISAPGTSIVSNGTFRCGSQTITAAAIGYAGSTPSCGSAKFPGAAPSPQIPVSNPCAEIAGCNYLSNNPPPATSCQNLVANMNPTISPGCYNNLSVGTCGTVTFLPGTYVLNGTSTFSNSSFVGSGVTFYVTANGTPPDFSQATSATITPPTSGSKTGVLYYQVPTNTKAPDFSGSSVRWSGLVYAPNALNVNFNGAKGDYTVLVLGSANLNDASGYTFATPPPGATLLKNVVLGQ